jgi:hypothetical protein
MSHNIDGLHIYEEGDFDAPRGDVWGISDIDLFEFADGVLNQTDRPFIAMIHTSGNHRPYTIPEDSRGFKRSEGVSESMVREYGFRSLDAFESFRLLDHSLGYYMDRARKSDYFANTLFVVFGDNGTSGKCPYLPAAEEELGLGTYHVPFAIYGPGLIREPRTIDTPVSQVDIMPTLAGLIGESVLNTTVGRNVLDPRLPPDPCALIMTERGAVPGLALVASDYYLTMDADGSNRRLYPNDLSRPALDMARQRPARTQELSDLCLGLYETSRYLLYHNSPDAYSHGAGSKMHATQPPETERDIMRRLELRSGRGEPASEAGGEA